MTRGARRGHRDLIATGGDGRDALVHSDRLETVTEDASCEQVSGAKAAYEHVRETCRGFEEFNIPPQLALHALFARLHGELGGVAAPAA